MRRLDARGLEYGWAQETDEGLLCDEYGEPYPEAVQKLRAALLPTVGQSPDALIRNALYEVKVAASNRPTYYSCLHCRDGKDLPQGYVCNRCGADKP
jgi:hypothetical protein